MTPPATRSSSSSGATLCGPIAGPSITGVTTGRLRGPILFALDRSFYESRLARVGIRERRVLSAIAAHGGADHRRRHQTGVDLAQPGPATGPARSEPPRTDLPPGTRHRRLHGTAVRQLPQETRMSRLTTAPGLVEKRAEATPPVRATASARQPRSSTSASLRVSTRTSGRYSWCLSPGHPLPLRPRCHRCPRPHWPDFARLIQPSLRGRCWRLASGGERRGCHVHLLDDGHATELDGIVQAGQATGHREDPDRLLGRRQRGGRLHGHRGPNRAGGGISSDRGRMVLRLLMEGVSDRPGDVGDVAGGLGDRGCCEIDREAARYRSLSSLLGIRRAPRPPASDAADRTRANTCL